MSDISTTYQEQREEQTPQPVPASFATVGTVYGDGISLIFDGETEASTKHYKCNQYCKFSSGQRVFLQKDSGTYVVLFPIGSPASVAADSASYATSANKATTATSASSATNATNSTNAKSATGVKNTGTGSTDIQFRVPYTNQLQYRVGSNAWHTLTNAN